MSDYYGAALQEHIETFERMRTLEKSVDNAVGLISRALSNNKKIMFCGNGGSAADAQHLAAELVGRFHKSRRSLAAISLAADSSALTCIGNDFGYDNVFARQVEGLGNEGDVLLAISTSGSSINVIRAAESAKKMGIHLISMIGMSRSALSSLSDISICIPSNTTAHIQEAHIFVGHCLCQGIELRLGLCE